MSNKKDWAHEEAVCNYLSGDVSIDQHLYVELRHKFLEVILDAIWQGIC